jgi:hypothetical protein
VRRRSAPHTQGCLEYGVSYMPASGFALFSRASRGSALLVDAILSYQVLNAATPVLIAIVTFGWVMWLLERRANPRQFNGQHSGVCACVRAHACARCCCTAACIAVAPLTRRAAARRRLCVRVHGHVRLRRCGARR